jgi:hypothetical protein
MYYMKFGEGFLVVCYPLVRRSYVSEVSAISVFTYSYPEDRGNVFQQISPVYTASHPRRQLYEFFIYFIVCLTTLEVDQRISEQ